MADEFDLESIETQYQEDKETGDYAGFIDELYSEKIEDAVTDEVISQQNQDRAAVNLDVASRKNPDDQAQVFSIADQTGIHPDLVDKDLPEFKRKRALSEVDLSQSPKTSAYLSNPKNALLSSDDIERLKSLENAMARHADKKITYDDTDGFLKNTAELAANRLADIGTAGMQGMAQLENFVTEAAGAYKPGMKEEFLSVQKKTLDDIKQERFNAKARHTPEQIKEAFGRSDVSDTLGETGLFIAETGIQSLADWAGMAFNFPAYVMARSVEIGEERAANNNEEAELIHTVEAMPFAIASSMLDRLGRDGILKAGKESVEDVAADVSQHIVKKVAKETGKAGAKEALTEAIQEGIIEYTGEKWGTEAEMSIAEAMERGAWGGLAGGGMGVGMGAPISAFNERAKRIQLIRENEVNTIVSSTKDQATIDAIVSYAQGSTTNERATAQSEEFVDSLGDAEVKITEKAVLDAQRDGFVFPDYITDQLDGFAVDVSMPASKFAVDIAPNQELMEVIRPHLRMSENAVTPAEMEKIGADLTIKELVARGETEAGVKREVDEIFATVKDQLVETGRLSEETARVSAQVVPAYVSAYVSRAREQGQEITPSEVFEKMGLTIVGPDVEIDENGDILEQAKKEGYEGVDQVGADEWIRAKEKGLDMSQEARMDRAREMGFDVDRATYHGTSREGYVETTDIKAFDQEKIGDRWSADESGFFFTTRKSFASDYARSDRDYREEGAGEGVVYPIYLKTEKPLIIDENFLNNEGMAPIGINEDTISFWDTYQSLIFDWYQDGDYDSIILRDSTDLSEDGLPTETKIVFEPNQIRSVNAAFDPDYKESPQLLAQGGEIDTDSEAFKNWFGDSKVVDDNGLPLFVHHGGLGASDIEIFSADFAGQTTGNNEIGVFHFTDDIDVAEDYGRQSFIRRFQDDPESLIEEGVIPEDTDIDSIEDVYAFVDDLAEENIEKVTTYLKIENPIEIDMGGERIDVQQIEDLTRFAVEGVDESYELFKQYRDLIYGEYEQSDINDYREEIEDRARENDGLNEDEEIEEYQFDQAAEEILSENGIEREETPIDGIIIRNMIDDIGEASNKVADQFIVFNGSNIKSVNNVGTFDPSDPDIYRQKDKEPLAEILLKDNGERIIKLREASDLSSFLHEGAHLFLEMEKEFSSEFGQTKDHEALLKFLDVDSFEDIGVNEHEKFAESFEVYLREGKAPSIALRDVFARFKSWLTQIYQSLISDRLTRAELNPEVTEVFDRLLATQAEIDEATANPGYDQYFRSKEQSGMSDAEWEAYQKANEQKKDAAQTTLDEKILKELTRQKKKEWISERSKIQKEEEILLAQEPVYLAREHIKENKLDREQAREVMGLPRKLTPAEQYEKRRVVQPDDSLLIVAAKTNGLDKKAWSGLLKDDTQMKGKENIPIVGMPIFKDGGMTPDRFVELAGEYGFGDLDINALVDMVQAELDGKKQYTPTGQEMLAEALYNEDQGIETKKEITAQERLERQLAVMTIANNGADIEFMAEEFGFDSAEQMINELLTAPPLKTQAKENAQQEMLSKYGDILNDGSLKREAEEAVHNEEQAKVLYMEMKALKKKAGGMRGIDREYLKGYAKDIIASMTYNEIKPNKYYRATVRAAVNTAKADNHQEALEYKTQQLINHYLYKEALETKRKMDTQRRYISDAGKKEYNPKNVAPDYIANIKLLVNAYDMRKSPEQERDLDKLLTWYGAQIQAAEELDNDENGTGNRRRLDWVSAEIFEAFKAKEAGLLSDFELTKFDDMTASDLKGLYDTVKYLRFVGGRTSDAAKEEYQRKMQKKADTVKKFAKKTITHKHQDERFKRIKEDVEGHIYSHRDIGGIIDTLNGFQEGAFTEDYDAIVDASNKELELNKQFAEDMNDALKDVAWTLGKVDAKLQKLKTTIVKDDGVPWTIDKKMRFTLGLNMGNQSNREALLQGLNENYEDKYTENDLLRMMATMSQSELTALNKVWAAKEKIWPEASATSRKLTGVSPTKIEPLPFIVNGVDLTGGHLKLNYRPDAKDSGRKETEIKNIHEQTISLSKASSQIERVGSGGREVDLNALDKLFSDVAEDIHYIAWAEAAAKLSATFKGFNNPVVKAIQRHYGKAYYNNLIQTIDGLINQPGAPQGFWKFAKYVRSNLTYGYLALSLRNFLQQPLAGTNVVSQLGEKYSIFGLIDFYSKPFQNIEEIDGKSAFMNNRTSLVNREAREQLGKISALHPMFGTMKNFAFTPQTLADALIAYPAWMGAYRRFKAENPQYKNTDLKKYEDKAIKYADRMVQKTVGSGQAKDIGSILNKEEHYKQITFMGTFFNITYNMHVENAQLFKQGKIPWYEYARRLGWMAVMPGIAAAHILDNLPQDDEDYWYEMLKEVLMYNAASMFLLRELSSALQGFDNSLPMFSAMKGLGSLAAEGGKLTGIDIAKGETIEAKDFDSESAVRIIKGLQPLMPLLGSSQVARTMQGLEDENQSIYGALVEGKERNK